MNNLTLHCGTRLSKQKKTPSVIPFEQRYLNLGATPDTGTFISTMDLDLTVSCNLRCPYCFKEKWNEHMEEQVAFDAVVWLLYASGPIKRVVVNFMGGEPLMRFNLIRRLVPFGKRRAWQMGKRMHFAATTNGTLITDKVVDFWKKWDMGFHTSIDGIPEIQNQNRPMISGRGSAKLVEKAVPKVLFYRPETTARCTVTPETVNSIVENYYYFRSLGYTSIAIVPNDPSEWTEESNIIFEKQFFEAGELLIKEYREGRHISFLGVDTAISGAGKNQRAEFTCGAGRNLMLVDIHGNIWPCHRWNTATAQSWRIGSIYEHFDQMARAELDVLCQADLLEDDCKSCIANKSCCGGCLAQNLKETGKIYKRHPNGCKHEQAWARVGQHVHDVLYKEKNETFLKHFYKQNATDGKQTHEQ